MKRSGLPFADGRHAVAALESLRREQAVERRVRDAVRLAVLVAGLGVGVKVGAARVVFASDPGSKRFWSSWSYRYVKESGELL